MRYLYDTRKDSYRFASESLNFFINVGLQVTRRCNLKCVYCCEEESVPDADLKTVKKIVDRLVAGGLKRINVTGGEPLLRDDIESILKYIKAKNVTVTLSTNGMGVDENILKKVRPYIDNIRFSLRGIKQEHDEITGNSRSFEKVTEAIRLSRKVGLPVSIVSTIIAKNRHSMEETARFCERNGVEKFYYFSLIPRGRAIDIFNRECVSITEMNREYNRIMSVARAEGWNMDIKLLNYTIEGECVLIFPNGDVVAVPSFTSERNQLILGNVLRDDIKDIWKKYPFKENYLNYYQNH